MIMTAFLAVSLTTALPDCTGKPVVRPTEVTLACGDGNAVAQKLSWTGWGERFAAAVGTLSMNDCTPNCAAGHFHSYPVVLVAQGSQRCPDGRRAYRLVTYAVLANPSQGPGATNSPVPFTCGPRR